MDVDNVRGTRVGRLGVGQLGRRAVMVLVLLGGVLASLLTASGSARVASGAVTAVGPYLAYGAPPAEGSPAPLLAVEADAATLVDHLHGHGTSLTGVRLVDALGQGLTVDKTGRAEVDGTTMSSAAAVDGVKATFEAAQRAVQHEVLASPACVGPKKHALSLTTVTLVDQQGAPLPLESVARAAAAKVARLHDLRQVVPVDCLQPGTGHKGSYLHNLWHRITGTSGADS